VDDFRAGRVRYLVNCMIATEGFDAPTADLIVQGRPTLSRALYSQMIGRGTRALPGVVDRYGTPDERRGAIAARADLSCYGGQTRRLSASKLGEDQFSGRGSVNHDRGAISIRRCRC
jgi:superfamily II DNA or RNA helicase